MDRWEPGTEMEGGTTAGALESVTELINRWHGRADGRLGVALSPRGPGNATPELWRACVGLAAEHNLVLHTHVSENREQAERLAGELGGRDAFVLDAVGALGPRLVMAHCVWLDAEERSLVRARGAHVCHCPSANLKLASGVAPIPEYLAMGINVALGADGAACNNNLSAFTEMRLAALLHKPRCGPRAMPAASVFDMATMGGARALGLEHEIGSLEIGKRADLVVVDRDALHARPIGGAELVSQLAYAHTGADVRDVVVDGEVVVRDGALTSGSEVAIVAEAERQRTLVLERARLS
jgi:5-methylthioadenosine/S-adenosylhomocysteine deaminase